MFINLARRSQILVDRLIGHLDRLERGEEDPDRLAELFQLDHLATRMRRNSENLLVLAVLFYRIGGCYKSCESRSSLFSTRPHEECYQK